MSLYIIAFSRFFFSSITSLSHFSNTHKIVLSTASSINFSSLTMLLEEMPPSFHFLLLLLPSNYCIGFNTYSPSPCHCSFIDMPYSVLSHHFSSQDCPKLFSHSRNKSWSILSITLVIVFAYFLISLQPLWNRHSKTSNTSWDAGSPQVHKME